MSKKTLILKSGETITDVDKFIESHESIIKHHGNKLFAKPYKDRLDLVKKLINKK